MSEITRYVQGFDAKLHSYPTGGYVLYTDHVAAIEAVKATVRPLAPLEWHGWKSRSNLGDLYSIERLSENVIQTHKNGTAFLGWKATHAEAVAVAQEDYERVSALVQSPALEANQQVVEALRAENVKLRQIICDSAEALSNGAIVSLDCSIDFMAAVPHEISLVIARLSSPTQDEVK